MSSKGVFVVKTAQAPEPIEVGMYQAKFISWDEKDEGQYGPYIRLDFEITGPTNEGVKRNLVASRKLTRGKSADTSSKLFKVVQALLGREPGEDEQVSLDDLIGTECQILVEDKPGSSEGWQEIASVHKARK